VGSVFSPYYAFAQRGKGQAAADNHCALNVALYSRGAKRWSMTERGQRHCNRDQTDFNIGPSQLHWDGSALTINIHEVGMPIPHRIQGQVRVHPQGLFNFSTPLDAHGRHRWGPLAPQARVEVALQHPAQRWRGHGYLDSNEGDEPIARAFTEWDWSRGQLKDGSTAVIYDVEPQRLPAHPQARLLALRFKPDGHIEPFEAPASQRLPRTRWGIDRRMRSDGPVSVLQQLEDTPFYQRAVLQSSLLGEQITSFHETLNVPRLVSPVVQAMLPWRMPRRA
jgi:carotenoid 1,2-hydratase